MSLLVWDDLLLPWQAGDFRTVHDWLNERWARAVQGAVAGEADPFARFLQGLAFAALAFHFAGEQNRESAAIFADDGLMVLSRYPANYAGVEIPPIVDALAELQNLLSVPSPGQSIPHLVSSVRALRFAPVGRA